MRSQDWTRQKAASVAFDVRRPDSSAFKSLRVHSFAISVPSAAISVSDQLPLTAPSHCGFASVRIATRSVAGKFLPEILIRVYSRFLFVSIRGCFVVFGCGFSC
jgi:hypothetical protein